MIEHKKISFDVCKESRTLKDLLGKFRRGQFEIVLFEDIYDNENPCTQILN